MIHRSQPCECRDVSERYPHHRLVRPPATIPRHSPQRLNPPKSFVLSADKHLINRANSLSTPPPIRPTVRHQSDLFTGSYPPPPPPSVQSGKTNPPTHRQQRLPSSTTRPTARNQFLS